MGEYLKRCESATIKCRATEEEMQLIFSKKRKVYSELQNEYCGNMELVENLLSPEASRISGFSKNKESSDTVNKSSRSPDLEKIIDLQFDGFEMENSTSDGRAFSREATPTSELYGDSKPALVYLSPKSKKKPSPPPMALRQKTRNSVTEIMPSAVELEEFFAAAEKYEQKRFAEKYNYDIVKDVPLEGKYQWVPLLP